MILGGGVWSAERARCSACWRSWLTCESRDETLLAPSESEEAHRIAGRNERDNWSEKCEGGESPRRRNEEESCNISFTTNTILVVLVAIDQTSINYQLTTINHNLNLNPPQFFVFRFPRLWLLLLFKLHYAKAFYFLPFIFIVSEKDTLYTCLYIYKFYK